MRNWIERWNKLTKPEQALSGLMIGWTVLFFAGLLIFWFFPAGLVHTFRAAAGLLLDMSRFDPLPDPSERFWSALALSLMGTLTFLCAGVAWDVRRRLDWTLPVLVSKALSTFFFLYFFATDRGAWAYLGGALLSDGPIFVVTLPFYLAARRAQREALGGGAA